MRILGSSGFDEREDSLPKEAPDEQRREKDF